METGIVVVSPKFQVVLPKIFRELLSIRPGRKIVVLERAGKLVLIPLRDIRELKGCLKGMTTEGLRNHDDRFWQKRAGKAVL